MMRTVLLAAAILLGSAAAASAADFRVVGVNRDELWIIEPAAIVDDQGVRRAHIYQVNERGPVFGGRTVRYVDQLFVFDCAAGTYHPEEFIFMDAQFGTIGRSPFPGAEGRTPAPQSTYGRIMAAVCGTDPTALGPTITAEDWKAAAATRR